MVTEFYATKEIKFGTGKSVLTPVLAFKKILAQDNPIPISILHNQRSLLNSFLL